MKQTQRRKWKKRLLWAAPVLILLIGLFFVMAFTRLHFSNQRFPAFARIQGNHQPGLEPNAVRPQVIGHRGSAIRTAGVDRIIGNTESAIRRAIDAGVEWIEIDIRTSRDGHLVVFHDEQIDRKTSGEGRVADLRLEQLRAVEVLVEPRETILTLDEVFERFHSSERRWVFDIKVTAIQDQLLPWIDEHLSREQVILLGVDEVLREYERSAYALGYIVPWRDTGNRLRVLFAPSKIIERCQARGCEYLVLPIIFTNQWLVDEANARGISVWTYGTDNEVDLTHAAGRGIGGVIVDRPESAMSLFGP